MQRDPRSMILFGAVVVAAGVAVAGTVSQSTGGVIVLIGWLTLAFNIHRFGRTE